ncbi:unnamed protein product [Amoebophrya sp. A120]|nr:unnamed protein product [Amoebophrya sp. A120]|eukprot:GSA120T00014733001.1
MDTTHGRGNNIFQSVLLVAGKKLQLAKSGYEEDDDAEDDDYDEGDYSGENEMPGDGGIRDSYYGHAGAGGSTTPQERGLLGTSHGPGGAAAGSGFLQGQPQPHAGLLQHQGAAPSSINQDNYYQPQPQQQLQQGRSTATTGGPSAAQALQGYNDPAYDYNQHMHSHNNPVVPGAPYAAPGVGYPAPPSAAGGHQEHQPASAYHPSQVTQHYQQPAAPGYPPYHPGVQPVSPLHHPAAAAHYPGQHVDVNHQHPAATHYNNPYGYDPNHAPHVVPGSTSAMAPSAPPASQISENNQGKKKSSWFSRLFKGRSSSSSGGHSRAPSRRQSGGGNYSTPPEYNRIRDNMRQTANRWKWENEMKMNNVLNQGGRLPFQNNNIGMGGGMGMNDPFGNRAGSGMGGMGNMGGDFGGMGGMGAGMMNNNNMMGGMGRSGMNNYSRGMGNNYGGYGNRRNMGNGGAMGAFGAGAAIGEQVGRAAQSFEDDVEQADGYPDEGRYGGGNYDDDGSDTDYDNDDYNF